jgi:hypothetical protein
MSDKKYDIFTSYFSLAAKHTSSISICPKTPPWFVMGRAKELCCDEELYKHYFRLLDISKEEFKAQYIAQTLSKLDPYEVLEKYNHKLLLGWYKPPKFDCRNVFVEWIHEETGFMIPEATQKDIDGFGLEFFSI